MFLKEVFIFVIVIDLILEVVGSGFRSFINVIIFSVVRTFRVFSRFFCSGFY